jgi:hypothetical protein
MFFTRGFATCSYAERPPSQDPQFSRFEKLYRLLMSTISDILAPRYGVHTCRTGRVSSAATNDFQPTHTATRMGGSRRGLFLSPRGELGYSFEPGRLRGSVSALNRSKSMATCGMRNPKGHDGYVSRTFVAPDTKQEFLARHPGQVENKQDQLRSRRLSLCVPAGAEQVI